MEKTVLVVVDMQKDFLEQGGKLTLWQQGKTTTNLKQRLAERIKQHQGPIVVTYDTHIEGDAEFEQFPEHCLKGTDGWKLSDEIESALSSRSKDVDIHRVEKHSFQGQDVVDKLLSYQREGYDFEFTGVCTHICVRSNVEALVHQSKEGLNQLPKIKIQRNLVDDFDPEMAEVSLKLLQSLSNTEVV